MTRQLCPRAISLSASRAAAAGTKLRAQWGMLAFLFSEVAFFTTLIVVYLCFLHQEGVGPTPAEACHCRSSSARPSACSPAAWRSIWPNGARARTQRTFVLWWAGTIVLGVAFLLGTAIEWRELIQCTV